MNEGFPDSINEYRLAKYFAGELSSEETKEIDNWAGKSPANQELLLQLQVIWTDIGKIEINSKTDREYDANSAWKKVKARKSKVDRSESSFSRVWKVAAAVILITGIGLLYRYFLAEPEQMIYTAESKPTDVQLEDGSKVLLNAKSKLYYPESFGEKERVVKLEGEAFFEVYPQPKRPFIVKAGTTEIRVLGTSFNIKMSGEDVTVVVESGKVLFSRGADQVILIAGGKAIFSAGANTINEQVKTSSIGIDKFWRTKTLRFTGQKLPDVIHALEEAYGVFIRLEDKSLENCSLSVTFQNDSLDNILDIIALTLDLVVKRSPNEITLSGKGCPVK